MTVILASAGKSYKKLGPKIKLLTSKLLKVVKRSDFCVEVYLVSNGTMRKLNKKYRGKDKTTNVLSFVSPKGFVRPPGTPAGLGEIYLAPDYIAGTLSKSSARNVRENRKNAEFTRKKALERELSDLLIHGFLHLLGFNHEKKNDRIKMQKAEKRLLHQFKISDVRF